MNPRLFRMLMNLENGASSGGAGAGAGGAGAAGAAAGGAGQAASATSSAAGAGAGAAAGAGQAAAPPAGLEALQKQVADLTQVVEKLAKAPVQAAAGASSAAAAPDAAAITAQVTAQVTFNTAMQLTPGLDAGQQGALRTLFEVEKPTPDKLGEWMKAKLALFGKTPGAAAPPPQSGARTDLGQAAGGAGTALPDDPRAIPIEQWKAMNPAERQAITRRWASRNGGNTGILSRNARS